jgi:lipopolysaccharide export system protein LptA
MLRPILPAVAALLLAAGAAAQQFNSNAPIDVDAARVDIEDNASEAVFSGNVVIRQAGLTLNADRVRITYAKDAAGSPQVKRLDAFGHVRITQDKMRATSNSGIYDVASRTVVLVGGVEMMQGTNRLNGQRVVWDLNTRRTSFDARSPANPTGRVTGRFTVPPKPAS